MPCSRPDDRPASEENRTISKRDAAIIDACQSSTDRYLDGLLIESRIEIRGILIAIQIVEDVLHDQLHFIVTQMARNGQQFLQHAVHLRVATHLAHQHAVDQLNQQSS